ncbi:MAG: isoleucine--tRNA ligase [Bacteroidota bacterium]
MNRKYPEYQRVSLPEVDQEIRAFWQAQDIFAKSVSSRDGQPPFVFYEGPPSANGQPGIHHVMARTIKDIFCRYKTLKGYQVERKAGWDTHGLPVELKVEKDLGIKKDDIGRTISIAEYNRACRETVMRFKDQWREVTEMMGYWVDLDDPYITYDNNYIESCWWLLKQLHDKDMLYKGYTIQPFSPAAGTGLSSHELNQPGAYREVKDTTIVAQFKVVRNETSEFLFAGAVGAPHFVAWTTTPWTLPSNTGLAVGKNIDYLQINTENPYTGEPVSLVMAEALHGKILGVSGEVVDGKGQGKIGGKKIDFAIVRTFKGTDIEGIRYAQLMPYVAPEGDAFRVVIGDFVTTEDGTGIVHIAPTFGADDFRVAAQNGISAIRVDYPDGSRGPLVDRQGRFVPEMGDFGGKFVKNYTNEDESAPDYRSTDVLLAIKLKEENKAFKVEKYVHDYPHCWRTDKPILYYPLDSWFVRTTAYKERLIELNKTINWKPASTGEGRFGNWLENLVDWNLSRSRFWGIPLPIWRSEDGKQELCIGSRAELEAEAEKAVAAGVMKQAIWDGVQAGDDLHRPFVDDIVLVSATGQPLYRETDLIDVWFDSGAMPYAQLHYPFENQDKLATRFPADFIAEGVDQTRGWFFTLHAISTMVFDSVAYKNVVSNGLVQAKDGAKMSKRLSNAVDPMEALPKYGVDAVRWYMVGNAAPWDNLRFNRKVLEENKRIYFGTLSNTYFFFAQYANIDGFDYSGDRIPAAERRELDRWILSRLNTLIRAVGGYLDDYEPHRAVKAMEAFLDELSNWYVRLSRRVFWKGEMTREKAAAYQTMYECLIALAKLMSPFAPFYSEKLYRDLNEVTAREPFESVHLAEFPAVAEAELDVDLEERMAFAREITSLVHSIRKNKDVNIKARQPLGKVLVPVLNDTMRDQVHAVKEIILSEVNVKELQLVSDDDENTVIVKKAKPNFRALGPRLGKNMGQANKAISAFTSQDINRLQAEGRIEIEVNGAPFELTAEDVDIRTQDVPGWRVASNNRVTVALDLNLTEALKREGLARDLVNRIQNLRKDNGLEVTDRIEVYLQPDPTWKAAITEFFDYICTETLAEKLEMVDVLEAGGELEIDGITGKINITQHHGF